MTDATTRAGAARQAPLIAAGLVLAAAAIGAAWYLLPIGDWLADLRQWMLDLGWLGVLIFVAVYIFGAIIMAPEAVLTVIAGFAYGFWGLPVVLMAATIGAAVAFTIARYLARERVRRFIAGRRQLAAIDRAIAEEGWKIVGLLRLSPLVPFNLQNYVFGVTAIPFRHFVASTFVGIVPVTAMYIYVGALGNAISDGAPVNWTFFVAGLLATAIVAVLITAKARASLRNAGMAD